MTEDYPDHVLWLDLEMTGLDASQDRILELAIVITDFNLEICAEYHSGVNQPEEVTEPLLKANPWFQDQAPAYQQDIRKLYLSGSNQAKVEEEVLGLVNKHIKKRPIILAGNSIHKDREFIRRWLPKLEAVLHYRMLDVSAWKVYMQGKHRLGYDKQEAHRALGDIYESIAELKFYLKELS